jgi:hypothetical protein
MAKDVPTTGDPSCVDANGMGKPPSGTLPPTTAVVPSTSRVPHPAPSSKVVERRPSTTTATKGDERTAASKPPKRAHRRTKRLKPRLE